MAGVIALCRFDELIDGRARGFDPLRRGSDSLFVVRNGERLRMYRNSCPHLDVPLEYRKDRFLSADGSRIVCYAHGAQFLPESGLCVHGPCLGQHLSAMECRVEDGWLVFDASQLELS